MLYADGYETWRLSGVYRIRNTINGRVYIGQVSATCGFRKRWREHRGALERGRLGKRRPHDNKHLQAAYKKYGGDAFVFEIVACIPDEQLTQMEQSILNQYPEGSVYNKSGPVETPNLGRKFSEEHRRRIGLGNKGKIRTPQMRARLSAIKQELAKRKAAEAA